MSILCLMLHSLQELSRPSPACMHALFPANLRMAKASYCMNFLHTSVVISNVYTILYHSTVFLLMVTLVLFILFFGSYI